MVIFQFANKKIYLQRGNGAKGVFFLCEHYTNIYHFWWGKSTLIFCGHCCGDWWFLTSKQAQQTIRMWGPQLLSWGPHNSNFTMVYAIHNYTIFPSIHGVFSRNLAITGLSRSPAVPETFVDLLDPGQKNPGLTLLWVEGTHMAMSQKPGIRMVPNKIDGLWMWINPQMCVNSKVLTTGTLW